MSAFKRFPIKDLPDADYTALAAALKTIYEEGRKERLINPKQNSLTRRKLCSIQYVPNVPSFIVINAAERVERTLDHHDQFGIFSVYPERQAVTWEAGKRVTPVPQHLRVFLRRLGYQVHGIVSKQGEALRLKRKREEEEKKYGEATGEERRKVEEEKKRKKKSAKIQFKCKIASRKIDLDCASRVMKWKASAANLTPNGQPTAVDKMLESAKRGPEHDLCEECGGTLKFCNNEKCTILGCSKCFEADLALCFSCSEFVCEQDWEECGGCINRFCDTCSNSNGTYCNHCDAFLCKDCSKCGKCGFLHDEEVYLYEMEW